MNQQHSMNVMLLCAGIGSRLRPFTEHTPKPVIPFLSAPLVSYSLELLRDIRVNNLVVNTHHLPDQVKYCVQDLKPNCKDLIFSHEIELLGSGGGIHKALPALLGKDHFLVMNGDEVILPERLGMMDDLIKDHLFFNPVATLLTMHHPEVGKKFGGAWTNQENVVKMFSKTSPSDSNLIGHHFVGAMMFSDRIAKYFKNDLVDENILYETLTQAMTAGEEVRVFDAPMKWFETGNPEDFKKASDFCKSQKNHESTWVTHMNSVIHYYGGKPTINGLD